MCPAPAVLLASRAELRILMTIKTVWGRRMAREGIWWDGRQMTQTHLKDVICPMQLLVGSVGMQEGETALFSQRILFLGQDRPKVMLASTSVHLHGLIIAQP